MTLSSLCLVVASAASFLIVLLHVALVLRPQWYRHFGADELAQLHEQGSRFTVLVTLGLALMFALWGAYALSGAGVIGRLPLLHAVLIAIGVINILRSLMLPSELVQVLRSSYPFRFFCLFDLFANSMAASPGWCIGPKW